MENEIQDAINNLGKFVELLNRETDQIINEVAKRENKTPNQVVDDWMKSLEGKTWGEVRKEIKDKYDRT